MFSRRAFVQGTAAVFGALLPALAARPAQAAPAGSDGTVLLDSTETPSFHPAPGQRHLRLSGSQLDRFNRLKQLFAENGEMRLQVDLDGTGRVLLETALNATGKTVSSDPAGAGFIVKNA